MAIRILPLIALIATLSGCALTPDYISPTAEHISHVTQHEPFTNNPTNFGYELVGVEAKWQVNHVNITVGDFYNADHALDGYRETFQASISYDIPIKK